MMFWYTCFVSTTTNPAYSKLAVVFVLPANLDFMAARSVTEAPSLVRVL